MQILTNYGTTNDKRLKFYGLPKIPLVCQSPLKKKRWKLQENWLNQVYTITEKWQLGKITTGKRKYWEEGRGYSYEMCRLDTTKWMKALPSNNLHEYLNYFLRHNSVLVICCFHETVKLYILKCKILLVHAKHFISSIMKLYPACKSRAQPIVYKLIINCDIDSLLFICIWKLNIRVNIIQSCYNRLKGTSGNVVYWRDMHIHIYSFND